MVKRGVLKGDKSDVQQIGFQVNVLANTNSTFKSPWGSHKPLSQSLKSHADPEVHISSSFQCCTVFLGVKFLSLETHRKVVNVN